MEHTHTQLILHQRQQLAQLRALTSGGKIDPSLLAPLDVSGECNQVVEFQMEGQSPSSNGNTASATVSVLPLDDGSPGKENIAMNDGFVGEDSENDNTMLVHPKLKSVNHDVDEAGDEDQESDIDDFDSG